RNHGKVYTEHAGYLLANGERAPPEIWGVYEQYASGNIDREEVEEFFNRRNYTSIVAYKRIYQLPVEDILEDRYRVVDRVNRRDMLLNKEEWRVYRWTG
ncbi:MAG: hypothetical protein SVS85_02445, partial [Candidatus Nanohaloarchaea archaeon]|nr:hypothetical protein [Candidatus Nanohaloarchaea archaeon]